MPGDGRSRSKHGRSRAPPKAERDPHAAIHSAEQSTKRQVAWAKVVTALIITAGSVAIAWKTEVQAHGGAPWWYWLAMGVLGTLAIGFGVLYWKEARRNGSLIERFGPYVKKAEKKEDANRSSSPLDPRGETREQ